MYHKSSDRILDRSPRSRRRTIYLVICAGIVVIPLVLLSLGVAGGGLFRANETVMNLYRRVSGECHPQMLDGLWRLELDELKDLCDTYEDLYGFNSVLAVPSPYQCRYTDIQEYSPPIPQFRVLGERHSGTNAIVNLMYANFRGTLDKKTVSKGAGFTHGPYTVWVPPIDIGITEHKHDEQTVYRGPAEDVPFIGLTVVAMRDPYDWIDSMSRNIYGGQERNKFRRGEGEAYSDAIERFVNTTWVGGDHIFDTSYADIFDLRYRKVCNHVASALKYSQHVMYLRHEDDVTATSKLNILQEVSRLGWPLNAENGESTKHGDVDLLLDKYFGYSGKTSTWGGDQRSLPNDLVDAVNRHANWAFEHALGYLQKTPTRPAAEQPKPAETKDEDPVFEGSGDVESLAPAVTVTTP